jgi:hypothetical protein
MNTRAVNVVRNGNFVEGLEGWVHPEAYPDVFTTTYRGRTTVQWRVPAVRDLLFQNWVGDVEPGHYVASIAAAALDWPPPRIHMSISDHSRFVAHQRIWYQRKTWEGHWVEFDMADGRDVMIQISVIGYPASVGNDVFFTDVALRRLGDLPHEKGA